MIRPDPIQRNAAPAPVEPDRPQAHLSGRTDVIGGAIANNEDLLRLSAKNLQDASEVPWVALIDPQDLVIEDTVEVAPTGQGTPAPGLSPCPSLL